MTYETHLASCIKAIDDILDVTCTATQYEQERIRENSWVVVFTSTEDPEWKERIAIDYPIQVDIATIGRVGHGFQRVRPHEVDGIFRSLVAQIMVEYHDKLDETYGCILEDE